MSMPATDSTALPTSGAIAVDPQGRTLPLRAASLSAHAGAGHARVVLEQTFFNAHAQPLDVTYTLPLPADAAVAGFRFTLGESEVVGRVQTKGQAREDFERALVEGRSAALLEEERSSVFTQRLGNVPPNQTMTVRIELDQPLAWEDGQWTWRFPTVVGPRYLGAVPAPDMAGVVVQIAPSPPQTSLSATLHIADDCTGTPTSPSHPLQREGARVVLTGQALDRDVVVRWPVARQQPSATAQMSPHDGGAYAAITVVPPVQISGSLPRHLVVLLDTSGSMGGAPLQQAKELTSALISTLGPQDHLELLAFAQSVERFHTEPLAMDLGGRRQALAWLGARQASGGTEMTTGIRAAVTGRGVDGAQKQVIVVTDGYIGFEAQIVAIALDERDANTRVHTVGVGSSVNRSLTEPVARAGGGLELIVGIDEPVGPAAARLVAHTQHPVVVDLQLTGASVLTTCHRLPDLYAGAPVTLYAEVLPGAESVVVQGRTHAGPWSMTVPLVTSEGSVAALRWARDQVADLELLCAAERRREERERRIEAIGLGFQISTRFTSWVATTAHRTVNPDGPSIAETQPQALPHGLSAQGVGLRQGADLFGAAGGANTAQWSRLAMVAPAAPTTSRERSRKRAAPPPQAAPAPYVAPSDRPTAGPAGAPSEKARAASAPRLQEGGALDKEEAKQVMPVSHDEVIAAANRGSLEQIPPRSRWAPWLLLLLAIALVLGAVASVWLWVLFA